MKIEDRGSYALDNLSMPLLKVFWVVTSHDGLPKLTFFDKKVNEAKTTHPYYSYKPIQINILKISFVLIPDCRIFRL